LDGKRCFKCHGYGHFQGGCPNWRNLTIREVEEIQAIQEVTSEEELKYVDHTLVTPNVTELLVI